MAATEPTGSLAVRAEPRGDGGPGGRLTVEDDGVGMTEAEAALALEPFHSSQPSLKAGLGLSAVAGLVDQMGGAVRIDSELGEGTRVEVTLVG